jgi:alkylated DNA nucleotide flippase Atl1
MTQSSARAQAIANILYELKRCDKLATHTAIANRAGFSAGVKGRSVVTSLKTVKRDWPHLQWWRAIADNGQLEKGSDQERLLVASGFEIETLADDVVVIQSLDLQLMNWHDGEEAETAVAQEAAK